MQKCVLGVFELLLAMGQKRKLPKITWNNVEMSFAWFSAALISLPMAPKKYKKSASVAPMSDCANHDPLYKF